MSGDRKIRRGILALRLNRPQRLNASTLAMARELLVNVQVGLADPGVRVLLLGLDFSAEQAAQWGLIGAVADDVNPLDEARSLALQLASRDPAVLGRMKAMLHQQVLSEPLALSGRCRCSSSSRRPAKGFRIRPAA